jgi:hypothetical protein
MQHFHKFIFFWMLFCASAFTQEIGIIQCDSDDMTSVPAWVAPGRPQVVEQLSCGQMVSITGRENTIAIEPYSSSPREYVQIEIGDNVAYVETGYIRIADSNEGLSIGKAKKVAPTKSSAGEEAEQMRWDLIPKERVKLRDEKLGEPLYLNGPRTFTATLSNSGAFPVSHLRMLVRLYDCSGKPAGNYSNCEIIGEVQPVISTPVPSGQTRKVTAMMQFDATPHVSGTFAWGYNILGVRAE